jgi:hypothetical protein
LTHYLIAGGKSETFAKQRTTDHLLGAEPAGGLKHDFEPGHDRGAPIQAAHAHADPAPKGNADTAAHFHADSDVHLAPYGDTYQFIMA